MNCPNKNDKAYKELINLFGEDAARVAWMMNGEKSPAPQDAIKLLYPGGIDLVPDIQAWKMPEYGGKSQKQFEPVIDKLILSDSNAPVGKGGESFNQIKQRSIKAAMKILDTAPYGSHVVLNSSVLKFIILWDKLGRPNDWGKITAEKYLALHTTPGETLKIEGRNGKVFWSRHGETDENEDGLLRSEDAILTDNGKKEADKIGEKFSKEIILMVYTSPLVRTLQTADRILNKQPFPEKQTSVQGSLFQQKLSNGQKLKYELQNEIRRVSKDSTSKLGRAIISLGNVSTTESQSREGDSGVVQNKRSLWSEIERRNLSFLGSGLDNYTQDNRGKEHDIYISNDKKSVIKINRVSSNRLPEYLRDLIIHNYLFPETTYDLLGFKREGISILPVVRQKFIRGNDDFDMYQVADYLLKYKFSQPLHTSQEFRNTDTGVGIGDINPNNVIFKDGVPHFIDPIIIVNNKYFYEKDKLIPSNKKLDTKVRGFLNKLGVEVQRIADEGQDFAAMADTINGVIKVVDGKTGINTLPHEATHMFLDLLPEGSKLLADILKDVKNKDEYDQVYEQYKDDPIYQKDGKVDEEKMAKEAAAHIIDDIIVDKHQEKSSMKWWERLWRWVKDLFKGKSLDNYETVAEDILEGNTGKLSKEKIRKMKEASDKGEIYYELDPAKRKRYLEIKNKPETSEKQKAIIDALLLDVNTLTDAEKKRINDYGLKPAPRIELDEADHVYADPKTAEVYESTTGKISGKFSPEKQKRFEANKDAGNAFDKILDKVINGAGYNDIKTTEFPMFESEDLMRDFVADARDMINSETEDGSFITSQMVTSDPVSLTAGSKDFSSISPAGTERIVDLKTSVRQVFNKNGKVDRDLSKTYTSQWEMNLGSVFNEYIGDIKGNPALDSDGKFIKRTPKLNDKGEAILRDGQPEYNEPPIKLSKEQQHAIQVGSYARMDELQGIPVVATKTWHINVDLQQKEDGSFFIKSYRNEGILYHNITDNQPYIDQVVPTQVDENSPSKLQKERPGYDYFKEADHIDPDDLDRLKKQLQKEFNIALDESPDAKRVAKEIIKTIEQREEYIKNLNRSKQEPAIQERTLHTLGDMKRDMMTSLKKGKYSTILNDWMDYTIRQSTITSTYLSDPDKLSSSRFPAITIQAMKFVQGYSYINSLIDQVHSTQIAKFNESVGAVNKLRQTLDDSIREWFMFNANKADTKYLEDEIEEYVNGNPKDISMFSRLVTAPSNTSSIPVSLAFREIAKANFDAIEYWNQFTDNSNAIEAAFHKALGVKGYKKGMYDFMTHNDGRFVMRTSPEYNKRVINAKKRLEDENRERKEYWMSDTEEAINFNKQLFQDIADLTDLTRAEKHIGATYSTDGQFLEKGYYDPGEYCEYKPVPVYDENGNITGYDDYEKEREIFEKQDPVTGKYKIQFSPDAVKDLRWMKEGDKLYEENDDGSKGRTLSENEIRGIGSRNYRNKFYYPIEKTVELQFDKGVFTGKVKPADGTEWRVKPQFKDVRDKSLVKDKDSGEFVTDQELRDKKYLDIMNDQSSIGRAKYQFYTDFMANQNKLLVQLSPEMMRSMEGRMSTQSSSLFSQIVNSDIPQTKMSLLSDQVKKFMNSTYIGTRQVDETGNIKNSIPIGDIGSFRNQEKIDKLKSEIEKMDAEWRSIKDTATKSQKDTYKQERGLKSAELKTEQVKVQPYQIEQNLPKAQNEFAMKIGLFSAMSKGEDKFLMIREMTALKSANKEVAMTDSNGRSLFKKMVDGIKNALTGSGASLTSNELARIDDMAEMILYKSNEYPGSWAGQMEKVFITLSAWNMFTINPPVTGMMIVSIMSTHFREAAVGQFFNLKQLAKSTFDCSKAVPQYLSNQAIKLAGGEGKKYASFPEAWMSAVQGFTKGPSMDSGGQQLLMLQHSGEWEGVAVGACAIGQNVKIVGADGTISNYYSRDIWNEKKDGTLVIKPNYKEAFDKGKFNFHRLLADYQIRFHGEFSEIGAMAITKYPGGRSLAFLHKYVPSIIMNRFGSSMIHSNLGFTEGSYITLAKGISDIYHDQGALSERFERGYHDMIPKGAIGNPDWKARPGEKPEDTQARREKMDNDAYENDPNFKKADGTTDWKKADRDKDRRKVEFSNMKRNIFDLVYLMMTIGAIAYIKSLAEEDHGNTKRWENFLLRSFDKMRRQQLFPIPVFGLQEDYKLLKSPVASLRIMGEFVQALGATFNLVVPLENDTYSTGIHKGESKAKVKILKVIPGANLFPWFTELNSPQLLH